jgi:phosphomannomutase
MKNLPMMSVSGIRGKVPEQLPNSFVSAIAYIQTKLAGGGKVVIGRDTRPTGEMLEGAICRGVRAAGGTPISIGIAPTPTTCFAVGQLDANAGVIITASHNPLPYNGYKMVHGDARLYSGAECDAVYKEFYEGNYPSDEEFAKFDDNPEETLDAVESHIEAILGGVDVEAIKNAKITVAVDSINGAGGVIFPQLLERLGVKWVGVHNKLDGDFVHNPEPRPEFLGDLADLLKKTDNTWAGLVFDPDADRLATMGENGEPISEEMTLVLSLQNVLAKTKSDVATNLSTSMVIDDVAAKFGVNVVRTKIGEANVVEAILSNNLIIGGEGNGGVIYPQVTCVRDGLMGTALLLELMATTGKKITELTSEWPIYPIIKEKIELGDMDPVTVLKKLEKEFSSETLDTQDGLKIVRKDGWVHLRASNTEPIMRCYAEAKTEDLANELAKMVMAKV